MGVKIAVAAVALALAASPSEFVASHQQSDGGFAETGQSSDANLTAWAVLGLTAAGKAPDRSPADYLSEAPATSANDLALRILALRALGRDTGALVDRLEGMRGPNGRIGTLVNSTIWGVLALRAAGRPAGTSVHYLKKAQRPSGGWSWYPRGAPDSNDTAAAIQALRAAGVGPRASAIKRGLAYLRRLQRADGGLRAGPGPLVRRAVHRVGDPGFRRRRQAAGPASFPLPREPAPARRQLPLLEALRRDARLGHVAGSPALARKPFPLKGLAGRCSSPGCDGRSEAADAGSPVVITTGAMRPASGRAARPAAQTMLRQTLLG